MTKSLITNNENSLMDKNTVSQLTVNNWFKVELIFRQATTKKATLNHYNISDGTLLSSVTYDILEPNNNGFYFGLATGFDRNTTRYYRNIVAETI